MNMTFNINYKIIIWFFLLFSSISVRLYLAYAYEGNSDQKAYEFVQLLVLNDKNVYANMERYNYSPVWFWTLEVLAIVGEIFKASSHFVIRGFLSVIDVVTAVLVFKIASREGAHPHLTAALFLCNPVGILITGYHGQFENFALLFIILAVYFRYYPLPIKWNSAVVWSCCATGVMVKHIVLFFPLFVLYPIAKRWPVRFLLVFLTAVPFMVSFLPYWSEGAEGIRKNVFSYGGLVGWYGFSSLSPLFGSANAILLLKLLLVATSVVYSIVAPVTRFSRYILLCPLIFLVFTPGIGQQYFVLPLAFGALNPSIGYFVFTLAATVFLLGSPDCLALPIFNDFVTRHGAEASMWRWNMVWVAAVFWLSAEAVKLRSASIPQNAGK